MEEEDWVEKDENEVLSIDDAVDLVSQRYDEIRPLKRKCEELIYLAMSLFSFAHSQAQESEICEKIGRILGEIPELGKKMLEERKWPPLVPF